MLCSNAEKARGLTYIIYPPSFSLAGDFYIDILCLKGYIFFALDTILA